MAEPGERLLVDEDSEALEHIARALKASGHAGPDADDPSSPSPFALDLAAARALLDALAEPAALLSGMLLVHANPAFAAVFGYSTAQELQQPRDLAELVQGGSASLLKAAETGGKFRLTAIRRSGERSAVTAVLTPLNQDKELRLLILPQPSPPSLQKREEDDARAAAGRSLVEPRLDFLAKVSHEVRTPLNSIIGFTELMLQQRFGPIGNSRYQGYLEDVHQSGLYALSLLNDLLDISKIEAGKFELDFTAVEIPELVEDCVNSLQPLAKRERILLRTSLGAELPCVIADRRRLKQILLNLLSNAIKFTPEGGQVIVSGLLTEQGAFRLRVRDSGVGMTADEIAFAMQPFHQLDTSPRKQTGTGLGLPLTKALVDANRARFVVGSEPGNGTTVDVIFPQDRLTPQERLA